MLVHQPHLWKNPLLWHLHRSPQRLHLGLFWEGNLAIISVLFRLIVYKHIKRAIWQLSAFSSDWLCSADLHDPPWQQLCEYLLQGKSGNVHFSPLLGSNTTPSSSSSPLFSLSDSPSIVFRLSTGPSTYLNASTSWCSPFILCWPLSNRTTCSLSDNRVSFPLSCRPPSTSKCPETTHIPKRIFNIARSEISAKSF